jgi:hypothetical protein
MMKIVIIHLPWLTGILEKINEEYSSSPVTAQQFESSM